MSTFDWGYFFDLFRSSAIWDGAWATLLLATTSWLLASFLGLLLALGVRSHRRSLRAPAGLYIWIMRGVPLLVLVIFVYNAVKSWRGGEPPARRSGVVFTDHGYLRADRIVIAHVERVV